MSPHVPPRAKYWSQLRSGENKKRIKTEMMATFMQYTQYSHFVAIWFLIKTEFVVQLLHALQNIPNYNWDLPIKSILVPWLVKRLCRNLIVNSFLYIEIDSLARNKSIEKKLSLLYEMLNNITQFVWCIWRILNFEKNTPLMNTFPN